MKVTRQQEVTQLNRGGRVKKTKQKKITSKLLKMNSDPLNFRKDHTHLLKTGGIELSFVYDFHRHLIESVKSSVRTSARKGLRLKAHISFGLHLYRSQSHIIRKQFTTAH